MATITRSTESQKRNLSTKDRLPSNSDYILRLIATDFSNSKSSGNPMVSEEWEIDSPDTVNIGGDEVNIAGVKGLKMYFPVLVKDPETGDVDAEKTQKSCNRYMDHLELCGSEADELDQEDPVRVDKGTKVYARLVAEERIARKDPTPEQRAKGITEGEIMKNPVTGKKLISFYPKIVEIFGVAE